MAGGEKRESWRRRR